MKLLLIGLITLKAFPAFTPFTTGGAPLAYVTSNNSNNSTVVTPLSRTLFSGGSDSDASNHLNTLAGLSNQGIILQARKAGAEGNNISYKIEQPTTANEILRVLVAPLTTVSGYEIGGSEIIVFLPTDEFSLPVGATVTEVEAVLKTRLNQSIFKIEDNILE